MHTTLTSKGQMTIPTAVRARLGLEAGDRLLVTVQNDDSIILTRPTAAPARSLRGLLPRPPQALSLPQMDAGVAAHLGAKHRKSTKR